MGAAGPAIILVLSLAAMAFVGSLWLGYASDSYLGIVEDTAGGLDATHWPDFAPFDWFARLFQLAWLTVLWLVPAWLFALAIAPGWLAGGAFPQLFFLVFWLIVPVSLLSSMSAPSRLLVLYWPFLRRLAKHPLHIVGFYASSAGVLAAGIWCLVQGIYNDNNVWVLLAAPVVSAVIILHARLVGRLAYQVAYHTPEAKRSRKKKGRPPRAEDVQDPWVGPPPEAIPEIVPEVIDEPKPADEEEEDEWTTNKKAYGVRDDNPGSWEAAKAQPSYLEPSDPYEVLPPDEIAAPLLPQDGWRPVGADAATVEPPSELVSPVEQRLARRRQLPPRPTLLFVTGVYSFLLYERTLQSWVYMSLGGWLLIALARLARSVWIV